MCDGRWVLLPIIFLLASCMREPADPGSADDRVVILIETAPRDLDPRYASDASSTKVSRLIFCSLTTVETEDLRPVMEVAESVLPGCGDVAVGECRHWVVKLKEGIYWHDGVEVTAEDVVFTYNSIIGSTRASPFRGELQRKIVRVWQEDNEAHFLLADPYASFLVDLAIGLVPAHVLEHRGGLDGAFEDDFVGCGPFKFVSRYRDQKIVLERNELHWKPVKPRYVVVRTVPDEATRVLSIMSGSGHIVVNALSPPVVRRLEEMEEVEVLNRPAACTTYLAFNLLDDMLADVRIRHAIAHGIDRKSIVRDQFRGMAVPADNIIPPLHWAYSKTGKAYEYDPALAAGLLDEAGLSVDPATGYRASFTLKVTTDLFRKNIGSLLAYKLGEIGIHVELLPLELSTFLADVRQGNFEMYILQLPQVIEPDILRWLLYSQAAPKLEIQEGKSRYGQVDRTLFPPEFEQVSGPLEDECRKQWFPILVRRAFDNYVRRSFGVPSAIGNGNRSFFFDPYLDCMLDLGNRTINEDKRMAYYGEAQRIIGEEMPVLALWHEDNVAVVRKEAAGYRLLPLNRYSPVIGVERQ